jgi:SET domain-containing protein
MKRTADDAPGFCRSDHQGLKGNCARFINHSCGPNVQVVSCKYADIDEFQIGIVATEDIKAGTELGYDYGWQNFGTLQLSRRCSCMDSRC